MRYLSWVSVVALLVFFFLYLYWSWREERTHSRPIQVTFYVGLLLFAVLFGIFTWNTLAVMPARTHAEALTADVTAGKEAWQKYTCIDCHTVLGNGAYYAPDLTKAYDRFLARSGGDPHRARQALATFLQHPPQATADRRGMTDYRMSAADAQHLAAFLEWTSRVDTNGWPPAPSHPIVRAVPVPTIAPNGSDRGEIAMNELGCSGCHSIGGGTIVGPDLKQAALLHDRAELVQFIRDPAAVYRAQGKRPLHKGYPEMPTLGVSEQDADAIATYLLRVSGKERP